MIELLDKFTMADAKPTSTPMASTTQLKTNDGSSSTNATTYRQLVGSLQ